MSWRTTASIRLLVIISLIAMILLLLASSVGADEPSAHITTDHLVVSGETLWEIAGEYTPEGVSVRHTVAAIAHLSGLDGPEIHPGQVLTVPVLGLG
jgi:nucleoid-associated protein YgaU